MNTFNSLAAAWLAYRRAVVQADASQLQLTAAQRGFYAGAHAVLHAMIEGEKAEIIARLQTMAAECRAFSARVGQIGEGG